jgi:ubiquitin conjugation factor E4 B
MLDNPEGDTGTCFDFFQEAATRVQEDETARDALVGAMVECSRRLSKISMDGDYRSYMMVQYIGHSRDIPAYNIRLCATS